MIFYFKCFNEFLTRNYNNFSLFKGEKLNKVGLGLIDPLSSGTLVRKRVEDNTTSNNRVPEKNRVT